MKLYKRNAITFNMMAFLLLSVLYLHVVISLNYGHTAFSYEAFLSLIAANHLLLILLLLSLVLVFYVKKFSKYLIFIFIAVIVMSGFNIFLDKLDKMILVLNFLYVLLSAYFFLLWIGEVNDVLYTPAYVASCLGKKSLYTFLVEIENLDTGVILEGYLTNWDEQSVFVAVEDKIKSIPKRVLMKFELDGVKFEQLGIIMTYYASGYGVKFVKSAGSAKNNSWGWSEFYIIISDRGYTPTFIG